MDGSAPESHELLDPRVEPGHNPALEVAIAAWIHSKFSRTHSEETRTAYSRTLGAFREMLLTQRLDLDAADPRRVRQLLAASLAGRADAEQVEDMAAARAAAISLVAQAFAAGPVQTPYGAREVAATTANRRLAILSSFFSYALRQDLLRGVNPIDRLERRRVQDYSGAKPLEYADLEASLAAVDRTSAAGKRDLALLLVGLYTGRRLSELWNMRREHLDIRGAHVDIRWPRTKGGKVQFSRLPRSGPRGIAGAALVEWVLCLYGEDGREDPLIKYPPARTGVDTPPGSLIPFVATGRHTPGSGPDSVTTGAGELATLRKGSLRERPVWISLAHRNGTFGHPLSKRAIADLCERRLGTSKVHTLRHAQPISAPVLTPTGWKTIGDLRKGDAIIGSDGRPTEILGVYSQGEQEVYRVHFTDGAVVCCTADHLWTARRGLSYYNWRYTRPSRAFITLSTREIMESAQRWSVPVVEPVQFSQSTRLPIDPYTLGALLGDGHFGHNLILATARDETEVIGRIALALPSGHTVSGIPGRYLLSGGSNRHYSNSLIASARALELLGMKSRDKFIPAVYMTASVESRQELLRGLMDTDGAASKAGAASFTTISDKLAVDVVNLVRSLGGIATIRSRLPYKTANHRAWRLCIRTPFTPFHMTSKVERYEASKHVQFVRAIDRIEPNGVAVCVCIQVDNENGLYVTQDYVLTHNTFARGLEDAGAKISEIQAALDHESLATTGRYLQRLHRQDENPHLGKLSSVYGLARHLTPDDPGQS